MRVLLLPDKPNWAFHSIAQSLVKYNTDKNLEISIIPIKGNERVIKKKYTKFDMILIMGWQTYERVNFIDPSVALVGIHSHHGWDDRKTTPEKDVDPPMKLLDFLSKFKAVNAVSQRLYSLFKRNGLEKIYYTPNGVDTDLFRCERNKPHTPFTVGYSGSKAHDWRKGVSEFILPAAKKAGVAVKMAMLSSDKYIPLAEMPKFYHEIDCYICASSSEGFSLSVLEAASSGCPVISTRCGGSDELIRDGENGYLVERTISDISDKIFRLKNDQDLFCRMSKNMREYVVENYGWNTRTKEWIDFLKNG